MDFALILPEFRADKKAAGKAHKCGRGWQGSRPPGCTRAKKGEGASTQSASKTPTKKAAKQNLESVQKKYLAARGTPQAKEAFAELMKANAVADTVKAKSEKRKARKTEKTATAKKKTIEAKKAAFQPKLKAAEEAWLSARGTPEAKAAFKTLFDLNKEFDSIRADAANIRRDGQMSLFDGKGTGKPCGGSNIPKAFDCHVGKSGAPAKSAVTKKQAQ